MDSTFRIVLEDASPGAGSQPPAPSAVPPPPPSPPPFAQNWARLAPEPPAPPPPFVGSLSQQESEWARQGFNPRSVALKEIEARKQREEATEEARAREQAVFRERERFQPFDASAEARKVVLERERLEREENFARIRRQAVQREVEAQTLFDPLLEARKRLDLQREAEEAALKKQQREKDVLAAMEQLGQSPYLAQAQQQLELEAESRERARRLQEARWQLQTPAEQAGQQMAGFFEERDRMRAVRAEREKLFTPAQEAFQQAQDERDAHDRRMAVLRERHAIEGAAVEEARRQRDEQMQRRDFGRQVRQEREKLFTPGQEAFEGFQDERDARARRLEVLRESLRIEGYASETARQQFEEERLAHLKRMELLRERHTIDGAAAEEARRQVEQEREGRDWGRKVQEQRQLMVSAAEEARQSLEQQARDWQRRFDVLKEQRALPGAAAEQARQNVEERNTSRDWAREVQRQEARLDPTRALAQDAEGLGRLGSQLGGSFGSAGRMLGQAGQLAELPTAVAGIGEAGGLAAAAGPLAAALLVADEAAKQIAGTFDSAREKVRLLGDVAAMSASNDYLGQFNRVTAAASESLEQVPIIGKVWAAELNAAVQPVKSFAEVTSAFVARGRELSQYSGELAYAGAKADVRSLFADLREANALGPGLSRLTDASSEVWVEIRDLMLPMKKFVVENLAGALETMVDVLRAGKVSVDIVKEAVSGLLKLFMDFINRNWSEMRKDFGDTLKSIEKIMEDAGKPKEEENLLKMFQELEGGLFGETVPRAPGAGAFARPPIVGAI